MEMIGGARRRALTLMRDTVRDSGKSGSVEASQARRCSGASSQQRYSPCQ